MSDRANVISDPGDDNGSAEVNAVSTGLLPASGGAQPLSAGGQDETSGIEGNLGAGNEAEETALPGAIALPGAAPLPSPSENVSGPADPNGTPSAGAGTPASGGGGAGASPDVVDVTPGARRSFPPNNVNRLSIDSVMSTVRSNNITNVRDLTSALPVWMGESWTLMEKGESRHQATLDHPRLILYGTDARFLFAASSEPNDPLREVAEMAELDPVTGLWKFRQIDFRSGKGVLDSSDASCQGCHGNPVRPIWGTYPNWPGDYGPVGNKLTNAQVGRLNSLRSVLDQSDRFHTINNYPADMGSGAVMDFTARGYGYNNTALNFELNSAQSEGLVNRRASSPRWDELKYKLVHGMWCKGTAPYPRELAVAMGLDGPNDFQPQHKISEVNTAYEQFGWAQGNTTLWETVRFRTLDVMSRSDADSAPS